MKFSPSVCVTLVATLAEKYLHEVLLTTPMKQWLVTNSAVTHGLSAMTLNHLAGISSFTCIVQSLYQHNLYIYFYR